MHKTRNTTYQKKVWSASLFALAILVLVVSCPLKRFLINNYVSQTSIPSKSSQTSSTQYSKTLFGDYSNCCEAKNKTPLFQVVKSQQHKVDAPVFTINIFNHTGYYIHSFLNGNTADYNVAPDSDHTSLPIFLQHRSLLI